MWKECGKKFKWIFHLHFEPNQKFHSLKRIYAQVYWIFLSCNLLKYLSFWWIMIFAFIDMSSSLSNCINPSIAKKHFKCELHLLFPSLQGWWLRVFEWWIKTICFTYTFSSTLLHKKDKGDIFMLFKWKLSSKVQTTHLDSSPHGPLYEKLLFYILYIL